jgi:hypothetical protein
MAEEIALHLVIDAAAGCGRDGDIRVRKSSVTDKIVSRGSPGLTERAWQKACGRIHPGTT